MAVVIFLAGIGRSTVGLGPTSDEDVSDADKCS
jgi:hypothetical protein